MGLRSAPTAMAVAVQKLVAAKASGVAFTLNPANGDRSQIAIDAGWGLGPAVVSGEITPDHYLVDKVLFEITIRRVSEKPTEYRLRGNEVVRLDVSPPRATSACLSDDEVRAVAALALSVERHYGSAQDIEWAIDAESSSAVLVQARPETVWSRRVQPTRPRSAGLAHGILGTLCAPLHSADERSLP